MIPPQSAFGRKLAQAACKKRSHRKPPPRPAHRVIRSKPARPAISKMKKKPIDLGAGLVLQLPLAIGTLQWGTTWVDNAIINSKGCISEAEAEAIVSHFRQEGVSLFDTAEGYGGGTSEKRLGRCIVASDDASGGELPQALQMTKFLPVPWRFGHASFERALRESNKRMNIDCCPVYLLHSPVHWRPIEYWVESAAMCKQKGLLNALGLSNCNADQCRRAFEAGQKFGVPVIINQVHFSLLDYNSNALQEMVSVCKECGITIIAYSPIGQGLLTDGLNEETCRTNKPARMFRLKYDDIQPLRTCIRTIADKHQASMAQVAINWCASHGTVPLVGCRSLKQARDTLGVLSFDLSEQDIAELDVLALDRSTLESPGWRRAIFVSLAGFIMTVCKGLDWTGYGRIEQAR